MQRELTRSAGPGPSPARPTVADAMIHAPKLCDATTTVEQARDLLRDDHVHALLVVERGVLLAVVERADLPGAPPGDPAHRAGRLDGRVVHPHADLAAVERLMAGRRLAVVDDDGRLLGLLCRKRSGRGFCSDEGVAARALSRSGSRSPRPPAGSCR